MKLLKNLTKSRVGRAVTGLVGGLIGGGAGIAAGLDIDSALIIIGGIFILIFAGEEAFVLWHDKHSE